MKNSIVGYVKEIDDLLKNKKIENIDGVIDRHLIKISFYQHERFVHLIVTVLFAILSLISFFFALINPSLGLSLLSLMFIVLLIPYILHYYCLENNVQKMYIQYDELVRRSK